MHHFLVNLFGILYRKVAKPILFKISPDRVHHDMLKFVGFVGKASFVRGLTKVVFLRNYKVLRQRIHNLDFKSPVGVSAGFDKNAETVPIIGSLGFGFITVGSVTAVRCEGNPHPWFHRIPQEKSLVVHVGLANEGSSSVLRRLRGYGTAIPANFPVVLSVAKTNSKDAVSTENAIKDYCTSVMRAQRAKSVSMIELNISCPNTYGGEPFTTPELLERLLKAVDAVHPSQPVFVKMPSGLSWKEFDRLLAVIAKHSIAGVTIANLVKDKETLQKLVSSEAKGGLSGKPTEGINNELIARTYAKYGDKLTIIGVGGVFTAEDAYKKVRLGASLVALVTGMIYQGPQIAADINYGLDKLLKRDGFNNISNAIGVDVEKFIYTKDHGATSGN